jgi:hypothetical protein
MDSACKTGDSVAAAGCQDAKNVVHGATRQQSMEGALELEEIEGPKPVQKHIEGFNGCHEEFDVGRRSDWKGSRNCY